MRSTWSLGLALALAACGQGSAGPARVDGSAAPAEAKAAPPPDRLAPLHAFEEERRHAADFAHLPPSDRALGADPIAIRALPGAHPRFVGLLRGRDVIVLLDASLNEITRAPTPPLPTGLSVADDGEIAVSGEQGTSLATYRVEGSSFKASQDKPIADGRVHGLRDVALGRTAAVRYTVDAESGRLFTIPPAPGHAKETPAGLGPFRVAVAGKYLVVDALLSHTLSIFALDDRGLPADAALATIHHDGPIWGFHAVPNGRGLLVAAGGVEDHVLDRTEGSFGFIDSFVFLYRVEPGSEPERLAAINVSEHGVITPKAILLRPRPEGGVTVLAAGYGSDRLAEITWTTDLHAPPSIATRHILPGAASMALAGDTLAFADPLLDAWFSIPLVAPSVPVPVPVSPPVPLPVALPVPVEPLPVPVPAADPGAAPRSPMSRVGEALFFTNLMAPWDKSEGRLSRFTCETCHFEGYVDGRTHHTGRGEVHATTKPLLGLFNNRPHFTRALDPDLTIMVDNEFRAAGAKSDHDPWFSAADAALPWAPLLGVSIADLDPLGLRRALMTFLMDFTHRPNPAALGRTAFTAEERRGADVFGARGCEGCHQARLSTDDPATRVPRDRWESLVLSREGPIVWASNSYSKTGVEPYVHEKGARPTSLRRLYVKRPYFTNGSAKSLRDVLEKVRFHGEETWHEQAPEGSTALSPEEIGALLAFLELL